MTQAALAVKAGLSVCSISNIEHVPRKDTVHLLVQALQLQDAEITALMRAASQEHPTPSSLSVAPLMEHWGVPFQRNPFFTGRGEVLQQLHAMLHSPSTGASSQSATIAGLAGMGKTQTAIEYAYHYAGEYRAVLWMQAETADTISASLNAIARLLDLPEHDAPDYQQVVAAVTRWLAHNEGWLLIVDNVEDVEIVKPLVPPARQGAVIFTSRWPAMGF